MISKILKYNLINDVIDKDPAVIAAANPDLFTNGASDVPDYLWKSLKSCLLGTGAASSDLAKYVSYDAGDGSAQPGTGIVITDTFETPGHNPALARQHKDDATGAEVALLKLVIYLPRVATQTASKVEDICERIKMVLDQYYRQERKLKPNMLTFNTVNGYRDYFYCFWTETNGAGRLERKGSAAEMCFRVEYKRIVL